MSERADEGQKAAEAEHTVEATKGVGVCTATESYSGVRNMGEGEKVSQNHQQQADDTHKEAGITFCPLVLEAAGGGWSDALRSVVAWIASESKRSGPIDGSDASFKIAQRISCTLTGETRAQF